MFKIDYNRDDRAWQIFTAPTWEKLFGPELPEPVVVRHVEITVPIRLHVETSGHGWVVIPHGTLELHTVANNFTEARFVP